MGWPIDLSKLRRDLAQHEVGLQNDTGYRLADRVVQYCVQNKLANPYGEGKVFAVTHFGTVSFAAWCSDEARAYFAAQIPDPTLSNAAHEDDVPVWLKRGTVEFQLACANLFSQYLLLARKDDNPIQLHRIESWDLRQVAPITGSPADKRVEMARIAARPLQADGVGLEAKLIDAMLFAYQGLGTVAPLPDLLGQPDEDNWCYHRMTIVPDSAVAFPLIRQFTDRLSDSAAFGAWVWGVASGVNLGRQVLWISDLRGEGGKSKFITMLIETLFGTRISQAFASNKVAASNAHASSAFDGKLVVIAGDNKNSWLLHTSLFKELSGDDPVFVNRKYDHPYSTRFKCRAIVLSNVEPAIIQDQHNVSRTLWLKLSPLMLSNDDRDPHYATKCQAELPGFLDWCRTCYLERCPSTDYAIETNAAVRQAVSLQIALTESEYATPFDDYLTVDPDGVLTSKEWGKLMKDPSLRFDTNAATNFRLWILAKFPGAELIQDEKRPTTWRIEGIRLRRGGDWRLDAQPQPSVSAADFVFDTED